MAQRTKILKNPYKVLGLPNNSNEEIVKEQYRNLLKKHHPDNGGKQEKFIKINQAFEMIINREVVNNTRMEQQEAVEIATKYYIAFIAATMFTLIISALAVVEYLTYDSYSTLYAIPMLVGLSALNRYMARRTLSKVNMTFEDFDVFRDRMKVKKK